MNQSRYWDLVKKEQLGRPGGSAPERGLPRSMGAAEGTREAGRQGVCGKLRGG